MEDASFKRMSAVSVASGVLVRGSHTSWWCFGLLVIAPPSHTPNTPRHRSGLR